TNRAEVGKANADCHGPARPRLRPKPGGNPVGEMAQSRSKNLLFCKLPAERGLCTGRLRPTMRRDFPRIAIPCQRAELLSGRATDYALKRPSWHRCQLADGMDAALGQPHFGGRTYSPHQFDRE